MLITEMRVFPKAESEPDGRKLIAYASITFEVLFRRANNDMEGMIGRRLGR